jgi:ABC-type multidrug transport system permease subunit
MRISHIILMFYFGYWIYYDKQVFSIIWIILLVISTYLFELIISSIFDRATKRLESKHD